MRTTYALVRNTIDVFMRPRGAADITDYEGSPRQIEKPDVVTRMMAIHPDGTVDCEVWVEGQFVEYERRRLLGVKNA